MPHKKKRPVTAAHDWIKRPVRSTPEESRFQWTFRYAVCEGSWGWHWAAGRTLGRDVLPRFEDYATMSWEALATTGSHPIDHQPLPAEARQPLVAVRPDLGDESPYSLAITPRMRVVGIRMGAVFLVLWRDPDHTLFPNRLKYT